MLKILRDKKNAKKIWIILCAVIIVPFVFWGAGSSVRNRGQEKETIAGVIFGRKVQIEEYREAVHAVQVQALLQYGDRLEEVEQYLNIEGQAWERLILLHEAKRRRIRISDRDVVASIQKYPFFRKDGVFDEQLYARILRYGLRVQPRTFEEQARQNLMILELYKQETNTITADDKEVRDMYERMNEEISVQYIAGLPEDFTKNLKPDDKQLQDYYNANAVIFKKPVSFNAEYVSSDSEVIIRQIASELAQHKESIQISKDFNLPVKETGFFDENNPVKDLEWSPMIPRLLMQMQVGDVSPPFKAKDTYYVLRLKERTEAYIPVFEEVKDKVRERYLLVQGAEKALEAAKGCRQTLTRMATEGSIDLAAAAKEHGLRTGSTALFKFGTTIDELGATDPFWNAAHPLKDKECSDVISTQAGYYIVQVKELVPIDEKKFEEEKATFTEDLISRKRQEHFERFLLSLGRQAMG